MSGFETGGRPCVGIRREDRSRWERRVPIIPDDAAALREQDGVALHVQPSPWRTFSDDAFRVAGAAVVEELAECPVVLGVKEIPLGFFEPGKTYVFFSHVIKGQPRSMPALRRLMELGCNLIDYERVVDEDGRRVIFFGRHAGIAGALESLWALGKRLEWEGIPNPLAHLRHAYEYHDLAEASQSVLRVAEAIRTEGFPQPAAPIVLGVIGYGNVARGAWEILNLLPIQVLEPTEISRLARSDFSRSSIYAATFREEHTMAPVAEGRDFDLQHYYAHPGEYRAVFERYVPHLTAILNAIYWDPRCPRLITKAYLRDFFGAGRPRLRVIGDISCDIEGSMECTVQASQPDDPVYVYQPATGEIVNGVAGDGVVVMAVDILPSELPREASVEFSRVLKPYVPAIARADYSLSFEQLDLPPEIKRAVIVYHGELTPDYAYLGKSLAREEE